MLDFFPLLVQKPQTNFKTIPKPVEVRKNHSSITTKMKSFPNTDLSTSVWHGNPSNRVIFSRILEYKKGKKERLVATETVWCYQADLKANAQATQSWRNLKAHSLQLALPSTLILHENGAFQNCSSNCRNLKTPAFRFGVDGKHFENDDVTTITWFPWSSFSQTQIQNGRRDSSCVFKILRRSVDGKYLIRFQSENAVFKFLRRSLDGAYIVTQITLDLPAVREK